MKWFVAVLMMLNVHSSVWASAPNWQDTTRWEKWPTVGRSSLSVFFFNIFQSELKTPTGEYQDSSELTSQPLALSIVYQRDISKQQLIAATKEQWVNLGYDSQIQQSWLTELEAIYTSVKRGEKLVYITDGVTGEFHFYKNNQSAKKLGEITNESLNSAFLSIWLSPSTEYPAHREKLIGLKK